MGERIVTAFRHAGRGWTPGPVPADMPEDALAWARANGLLAPENKAHAAAPKKAVKKSVERGVRAFQRTAGNAEELNGSKTAPTPHS